jgi:hypothetical protein
MEEIFRIISEKPEYAAWAFGLINALWLAFICFNFYYAEVIRNVDNPFKQILVEFLFAAALWILSE